MADSSSVSEFNMAVSFLNSLRMLLNAADEFSANLDVYNWFHVLLTLRRELSDDMDEAQLKQANKYRDDIQPEVQKLVSAIDSGRFKGIPSNVYNELDEFELFLRNIINVKGYKGRMLDSPDKALRA